VVGNPAIMNVEPVFAQVLAWAILGQSIAPVPVGGRCWWWRRWCGWACSGAEGRGGTRQFPKSLKAATRHRGHACKSNADYFRAIT
jgi:hypothetical protein